MVKNDIHEIVLVDGSTRIPKMQKMLEFYFDGKEPIKSINPDEAVAYKTTLHARLCDKEDLEKKKREVEALLNKSGSLNGEASNAGMDGDSLVDSPPKKRIKTAPRSVRNSGNKK